MKVTCKTLGHVCQFYLCKCFNVVIAVQHVIITRIAVLVLQHSVVY